MGSIILDGAVLHDGVLLGAGSLVTEGKELEGGYLWLGRPAKKARVLTEQELAWFEYSAKHYVKLKDEEVRRAYEAQLATQRAAQEAADAEAARQAAARDAALQAAAAVPVEGHFHPKGKAPSEFTKEVLRKAKTSLPFGDTRDFEVMVA
jgi:glycine/D-amino acid oxidase-like deaminating enzyme